MKAETPQILWHNGTDNEQNKNAPVFSISLLESGIRTSSNKYGIVLATAGNHEVNLWKMKLCPQGNELYSKLDRNVPYKMVKVDLLTTLTRHSSTVNVVRFSPNGLHLASASDSGSIIIYSVPPSKRGGGNGRHYWSEVENEQQLSIKVLSGNYAIYDLDWSMDSRRLLVGTLDHCISVYEDENYTLNHHTLGSSDLQKESQWICVYRNARDHTHYVQGVAMDPQGVYVTSMSCDRTVRVFARKMIKKRKVVSDRLELGKGKTIKYYSPREVSSFSPTDASDKSSSKRIPLFAEEAASESFFRRLTWTADGAYLITPTALWKDQCATLIFRRHCYDAPCKVLPGHDKVCFASKVSMLCEKSSNLYSSCSLLDHQLAISCRRCQSSRISVAKWSISACRAALQISICSAYRDFHFNL
jgi:chromatin assembly factor 1 subunit B